MKSIIQLQPQIQGHFSALGYQNGFQRTYTQFECPPEESRRSRGEVLAARNLNIIHDFVSRTLVIVCNITSPPVPQTV